MKKTEQANYAVITETPGLGATKEQVGRLYQRYYFAKKFAENKDILEVACGSGLGLRFLKEVARNVIGVDIDEKNVITAKKCCEGTEGIKVDLMDAHDLAFADHSIDLMLLFEAIYYLQEPKKFIEEAYRILREGGNIIICTVNKDWEDFHPSPYAHKYFSVPEIFDLLKEKFNEIKIYGGFPVRNGGVKDSVISAIKRIALKFNLIPGSLKARAILKRIFMGELQPLPEKIEEGMTGYEEPVEIDPGRENREYKIIYAVARK